MSSALVVILLLAVMLIASVGVASLFGMIAHHGEQLQTEMAVPLGCQTCVLDAQERFETFCRAERREVDGVAICRHRR
jgi:hypothetical protein